MTGSASLFIVVFTIVNIVACVWLMWWTARVRVDNHGDAQSTEQDSKALNVVTGHVWDGDLEEYNNPLPRWWLGLFIIAIVFAAFYLALYPGLGTWSGMRNWSSVEQHDRLVAASRAKLEARLAAVKERPIEELARDPEAMATARNLFASNCASCHGSDARGAKGFPNLTDNDWLYGGDAETIYTTIAYGRNGVMPALGEVLGEEGVKEVASYVVSLSGGQAPADWVAAGQKRFEMLCTACHGVDAKGSQLVGAPNLTDNIWLHGRDFESIKTTIAAGRNNQMPAHLELLGEAKVRLLAAYVMSLSGDANPGGAGASAARAVEYPPPANES
jgi:cytochrome c oxidase cbb3-type subunit 3